MPALRLSRYEFAAVEKDDCGRPFLDFPRPLTIGSRSDDGRPQVGEGDSLFTLAWKAWRDTLDYEQDVRPSGFFWVIGELNVILDAAAPLKVGQRLRVPSTSTLDTEILAPPPFFERQT